MVESWLNWCSPEKTIHNCSTKWQRRSPRRHWEHKFRFDWVILKVKRWRWRRRRRHQNHDHSNNSRCVSRLLNAWHDNKNTSQIGWNKSELIDGIKNRRKSWIVLYVYRIRIQFVIEDDNCTARKKRVKWIVIPINERERTRCSVSVNDWWFFAQFRIVLLLSMLGLENDCHQTTVQRNLNTQPKMLLQRKKKKRFYFSFITDCETNGFLCAAHTFCHIYCVRHCLQLHSFASQAQWMRQVNGKKILNARERNKRARTHNSDTYQFKLHNGCCCRCVRYSICRRW